LLKQIYDRGVGALSGDFVTSAANLKELFFAGIIGGGGGLFATIKRLRGKKVAEATDDGDDRIVMTADNLRIVIPKDVLKLYRDAPLREHLGAVIRPVLRDGIDSIAFKDDSRQLESVSKDEAPYFTGADVDYDDATTTVIPRQLLRPADVSFRKNGKWRLNDGDKTRYYAVADPRFTAEVQDGTREIGAKDTFLCEVVMRQFVGDNGELKLDYEISSVIRHIKPGTQMSLPDDTAIRIRPSDE
jgi:hypothetical protein